MATHKMLSAAFGLLTLAGFGLISAARTGPELGQYRRFELAWFDTEPFFKSPLHQLGRVQMTVQNVARQRSTCCNVCKTNFPSTQMTMFFKGHGNPEATCSCLSHPNIWKSPRVDTESDRIYDVPTITGVCGSEPIELDGPALGPGIDVNLATVNYGHVDSPSEGTSCCEECRQSFPATRMFRYWSKSEFIPIPRCFCYSLKSGQRPITYAEDTFSAGCGCNGLIHGITCCNAGFTIGDSVDTSKHRRFPLKTPEVFIQADQYLSTCAETCKSLHPSSTGITESLKQTYTSGNGANKNKCWCEFGEPKLDYSNMDYQTCVFSA